MPALIQYAPLDTLTPLTLSSYEGNLHRSTSDTGRARIPSKHNLSPGQEEQLPQRITKLRTDSPLDSNEDHSLATGSTEANSSDAQQTSTPNVFFSQAVNNNQHLKGPCHV